jgi:putative FmdB family regulatory protein
MPLYDYDCAACGRRFEVVHGVHAERPTVCPICGKGPIRKAISAAAVHYKGSGWAKKERRATVTPGTSKSATGNSSENSPSETSTPERNGKADSSEGSTSGSPSTDSVRPVETGSTSKAD